MFQDFGLRAQCFEFGVLSLSGFRLWVFSFWGIGLVMLRACSLPTVGYAAHCAT